MCGTDLQRTTVPMIIVRKEYVHPPWNNVAHLCVFKRKKISALATQYGRMMLEKTDIAIVFFNAIYRYIAK